MVGARMAPALEQHEQLWLWVPAFAGTTARISIRHDLHAVARPDLRVNFEPVENPKTLDGTIDPGHAVGERLHGVAGLRGDDLNPQRAGGLNLVQRQTAERVHGFARVAVALGGLLLGGENEAVDVAAETQR